MSKLSITSLGCPGLQKERDLPHLCLQNPPVYEVQHEHQQQFAEKQDAGTAGMAKGRRATNALLLVQYPRKLQVNLWDFGFYRDNSTPARLKVAYSTTAKLLQAEPSRFPSLELVIPLLKCSPRQAAGPKARKKQWGQLPASRNHKKPRFRS